MLVKYNLWWFAHLDGFALVMVGLAGRAVWFAVAGLAGPAACFVFAYVFSNFDSNPVRTKKLEVRS